MSARATSLFASSVLALAAVVGCAPPAEEAATSEGELTSAQSLELVIHIADSKDQVLYGYESVDISVRDAAGGAVIPCRNRSFTLDSVPSLYEGWSKENAAAFKDSVPLAKYRVYVAEACRSGNEEVIAWFGSEREYETELEYALLRDDYDAKKMPLLLEATDLTTGAATYYACDEAATKTKVGENSHANLYDVTSTCKRTTAPTAQQRGPIDFLKDPGLFAARASYRPYKLPAVASNAATYAQAKSALLAKVSAGTYDGAMSTLGKRCGMTIEDTPKGLAITHTIKSSNRARRLLLTPENILGYLEGDLYADPIRPEGDVTGTFAAVELLDPKGEPTVLRFEKNDVLDGSVVRIDGAEAYCRRLVAE